MKAITLYIGLDVHKDSIVIAIAEPGRNGEIRIFGTITNDLHALEKALQRIRKAHPGAILEVAYEAGPLRLRHRTSSQTTQGLLPGRRSLPHS